MQGKCLSSRLGKWLRPSSALSVTPSSAQAIANERESNRSAAERMRCSSRYVVKVSSKGEGGSGEFFGSEDVSFSVCLGLEGSLSRPGSLAGGGKEESSKRAWSNLRTRFSVLPVL